MKNFFCALAIAALLAGCGADETTIRSDKPVSREKATNEIDIPLPLSARNVYYVYHAGGLQEFHMLVRFTVDSNDLDRAVNDILLDHDQDNKEQFGYCSLPIASAPALVPSADLQPVPWWNTQSITNGLYRACTNGSPFEIRVDLSTHTIYLSSSD